MRGRRGRDRNRDGSWDDAARDERGRPGAPDRDRAPRDDGRAAAGWPATAARDGYPRRADGRPDARYPAGGYAEAGYPGDRYRDNGYRDNGYRDSGYQDPAPPGSGYPSAAYPAPPYSGTASPASPASPHAGADRRGSGYRRTAYPDSGYREPGYPDAPGDGVRANGGYGPPPGTRIPGTQPYPPAVPGDKEDSLTAGTGRSAQDFPAATPTAQYGRLSAQRDADTADAEFTSAGAASASGGGTNTGSSRPYGRISIFTLLDDKVADFDRLAEQAAEGVRTAEPGTLVFVIHVVPKAPMQRIFYEIYRDRAAFESHERQPHILRFAAERRSCVLATNIIELRLKYAKVAPVPSAAQQSQRAIPAAPAAPAESPDEQPPASRAQAPAPEPRSRASGIPAPEPGRGPARSAPQPGGYPSRAPAAGPAPRGRPAPQPQPPRRGQQPSYPGQRYGGR
ncbi:MAG: antibiotic biosynthesis monooxygenase [Streptosporangiaceae bacterium]|nr:antibiotic biosynthesis monooxygenase [Streptosporangiaceae bacterium]